MKAKPGLPSPRGLVLAVLAAWAAVLSLETWFRPPGWSGGAPPLPATLPRQGRIWPRMPASPLAGELPEGVVLLEGADYGPIRVRRLGLPSSGSGVHMPVAAIGPTVLGPGGRGRCVVLAADGTIERELPTAAAWERWMRGRAASGKGRVAWLAGLRPYRANVCLWESLP
jgi:hypothetical protein